MGTLMKKKEIVDRIVAQLEQELAGIVAAAQAAHEAATHEESRSEDKHDTRGLEASYLAAAQNRRAGELKTLISIFRTLPVRDFKPFDPIGLAALVEVESNGKKSSYFLVGEGGGVSVQVGQKTIQVITPRAPLGEALQGRVVGDVVEVENQNSVREYEILSVS